MRKKKFKPLSYYKRKKLEKELLADIKKIERKEKERERRKELEKEIRQDLRKLLKRQEQKERQEQAIKETYNLLIKEEKRSYQKAYRKQQKEKKSLAGAKKRAKKNIKKYSDAEREAIEGLYNRNKREKEKLEDFVARSEGYINALYTRATQNPIPYRGKTIVKFSKDYPDVYFNDQKVTTKQLSFEIEDFEQLMNSSARFDVIYINYFYFYSFGGRFEFRLPLREDTENIIEMNAGQAMEYLLERHNIIALLYEKK